MTFWPTFLNELSKIGTADITPEQARRAMDQLESTKKNKATPKEMGAYAGLGAGAGLAAEGLGAVIKGRPAFEAALHHGKPVAHGRLRAAGSVAATSALMSAAVPLVRDAVNNHLHKKELEHFVHQYHEQNKAAEAAQGWSGTLKTKRDEDEEDLQDEKVERGNKKEGADLAMKGLIGALGALRGAEEAKHRGDTRLTGAASGGVGAVGGAMMGQRVGGHAGELLGKIVSRHPHADDLGSLIGQIAGSMVGGSAGYNAMMEGHHGVHNLLRGEDKHASLLEKLKTGMAVPMLKAPKPPRIGLPTKAGPAGPSIASQVRPRGAGAQGPMNAATNTTNIAPRPSVNRL